MNLLHDITGRRFGRLTAMRYLGDKRWIFKCDCGCIFSADSRNVKRRRTKSCGCLHADIAKKTAKRNFKR